MANKVTVLVAAYNAEAFITQCMDSLVGQTLREIQIVCIDDASTDGTHGLLLRYASDPRVTILRNAANQGQARARNRGLALADGEFVAMVDSDDWLAPDALAEAYAAATAQPGADAALFELVYYYDADGRTVPYALRTGQTAFTGEEAFRLSMDWSIHGLYLVRRDIHLRYPFDDTCRLYSDDNTTRLHFLHCRRVVLSCGKYFYRQHAASATHRCSILHFDKLDAGRSMKDALVAEGMPPGIVALQETRRWCDLVEACLYQVRHWNAFTAEENRLINGKIRRCWQLVDLGLVDGKTLRKFGYMPFRHAYPLFRVCTGLYGLLQPLAHRLKGIVPGRG